MNQSFRIHDDRRRGGITGILLVSLVLVGVVGAIGYKYFYADRARVSAEQLITDVAFRGPFDHIVLEQGEIESSSNISVICEVESRGMGGTAILWVIDEGAKVKKGDKLVELDSSQLELQLKEKRIRVITTEAQVATAEAQVEQAKIAKEEYLQGVYLTTEKDILSQQAIAEQEMRKAELALKSTQRLVAKGLVTSLQLEADQFALINQKNKLEAEQGRLRVLQDLTLQKMMVQYNSDIDSAKAALSAAQAEYLEEKTELEEIEKQIKNCVMHAPADGVVVHANRYSSRGGNAEFVVEPGATVRERQEIIQLPDPSQMQVKCKINESQITLIKEGMAARISVDALPDLKLTGRVKKVNRYAEPSSFFSSSIKEYATLIEIIDPPDLIRTGMTSEVQIFVEQLDNALQIPIQGLYEHGRELYTLVQRGPDQFETKQVKIKATNDAMACIEEGLEEGDKVVLNLRSHLSLMDLPELEQEDNSEMRELAQPSEADSGPAGEAEASRGPGGGDRGGFGDGGGPRGGGGGRAGGGGPPDVNTIVSRIMERTDTDGDGKISAEEISAMDPQRSRNVVSADADGDGTVTRAELIQGMSQRISQGGGRQQ